MEDAFIRFIEASGCRTQNELAVFLDIRQASVAHAKKRNTIPSPWLLTLLRRRGVNPDWVLTGKGARFLRAMPGDGSAAPFPEIPAAIPPQAREPDGICVLARYSAQELVNELVRRALADTAECHGNGAASRRRAASRYWRVPGGRTPRNRRFPL